MVYWDKSGLIGKVQDHVVGTIRTRQSRGQNVPDNMEVDVSFYQTPRVLARAKGNKLLINVLKNLPETQEGERVIEYFDMARKFLNNPNEQEIFQLIYNPQEKMDEVIRAGTYDPHNYSLSHTLLKRAHQAKGYLDKVLNTESHDMPELKEIVRHEVDHLDFFNSPVWKKAKAREKRIREITKDYTPKDKTKFLHESHGAMVDASEVHPLTEVSAFVAASLDDNYTEGDVDRATEEAYLQFTLRSYTEKFMARMIKGLENNLSVLGELDNPTSEYLNQEFKKLKGLPVTDLSAEEESQVNPKIKHDLENKHLPTWREDIQRNARRAVDAVGQAYKEDPARIGWANHRAENFEQYLEICRGKE